MKTDKRRAELDSYIKEHLSDSIKTKQAILSNVVFLETIQQIGELCVETIKNRNKILICGNGGSASDAQHFAGEICGRFLLERKGYACVCLNTDTTVMTAIANDYGYEYIFSRQVEANGQKGDVLINISTSGNSQNCLDAMAKAKEVGIINVVLTGKDGGKMAKEADYELTVPSNHTPCIQEAHITIVHILCSIIEKGLGGNV